MSWLLFTVAMAAPEICGDGVDNDGDGFQNEAPAFAYEDADGDGQGDPALLIPIDCATSLPGTATNADDCNDGSPEVFLGALESCDGLDNNCDGAIDEMVCSADRFTRGGSTYLELPLDLSWFSGRAACTSRGYDLMIIGSESENTFATALFAPNDGDFVWLGLYDANSDGLYSWLDQSVSAFESWGLNEPNQTNNDCAYLSSAGAWYDDDCNTTDGTSTVCEVECIEHLWFYDADNDGFGDPNTTMLACSLGVGFVLNSLDCDDFDAGVHPSATEVCDGVDNDCNPITTEGTTWYRDSDNDGFGDPDNVLFACIAPVGFVSNALDCDDQMTLVNPGTTEVCDGVDNDCNTQIDEGVRSIWYQDVDGDSFGDATAVLTACAPPLGYVGDASDCDDSRSDVFPDAAEVCDGVDNNCDTMIDEGLLFQWFVDQDQDGYGDLPGSFACFPPGDEALVDGDCDDHNPAVFPGAEERCDGFDNNCDLIIDVGAVDALDYYPDLDGDLQGAADASPSSSCVPLAGAVLDSSDCNDADPTVFAGAAEQCNGIDNDCDGAIDNNVVNRTWFIDNDGDGWGGVPGTTIACVAPSGQVGTTGDCDDNNAVVHPAADEICDSIDNNCDGEIDVNALDSTRYYLDNDGDGHGTIDQSIFICGLPAPGVVASSDDCDDNNAARNPSAAEICDGIDNDCNGLIDDTEGDAWYIDADGDGFGDPQQTLSGCSSPAGYVTEGTDCDDRDPLVFPGANEFCTGVDNNCDGVIEVVGGYLDGDGDGFGAVDSNEVCNGVEEATDCDDAESAVSPAAVEICGNDVDEDCDGEVCNDNEPIKPVEPVRFGLACTTGPISAGWMGWFSRR